MVTRTHKDLVVWQESIKLCAAVYSATRAFPVSERFGLTSQMRRAAVSISSNIAEGAARGSTREFVRFLHYARGSAAELETQCEIAQRCGLGPLSEEIADLSLSVGQMLNSLIRSLSRRKLSY